MEILTQRTEPCADYGGFGGMLPAEAGWVGDFRILSTVLEERLGSYGFEQLARFWTRQTKVVFVEDAGDYPAAHGNALDSPISSI